MSTPSAGREEAPPHPDRPDRPRHTLERDHSGAGPSGDRKKKTTGEVKRPKAPAPRTREESRELPTGTLIAVPIIIAFIVLFFALMGLQPPAPAPAPAPAPVAAEPAGGGQ